MLESFILAAAALVTSQDHMARTPSLLTYSRCETVGNIQVCLNRNGEIITRDLKIWGGLAELRRPTKLSDDRIQVTDFKCSSIGRPHCVLLARLRGELGLKAGRVLALDLSSNTLQTLTDGQFWFHLPLPSGIHIIDRAGKFPVVYNYDHVKRKLVYGWEYPSFKTIAGVLPLVNSSSRQTTLVRFIIDEATGTAKIFDQIGSTKELDASSFHSIDLSLLGNPSNHTAYIFGLTSPFLPGRHKASDSGLFGIRAFPKGRDTFRLEYKNWEIELHERIIQSRVPQIDMNGDLFFVVGSPSGTSVQFLCQSKSGDLELNELFPPTLTARLRIASSNLLEGVQVTREAPGRQLSFQHYELFGPGNGLSRQCASTNVKQGKLTLAKSNEDVSLSQVPETEILRLPPTAANQSPQSALILNKSHVVAPSGILIDVYGAVASSPFSPVDQIVPFDPRTDDFWVAQAILPGDGDLGRAFANSGATPNRALTVEALNALSEILIESYPSLKGNITLRAMSAGASTAVQAVLGRPDLYSGAILFAGAYDWREIAMNKNLSGFHSAYDQEALDQVITQAPEFCSGAKFIIIHAEDDSIASASQARQFADRLRNKNCLVGSAFFGKGGHQLSTQLMPPEEEKAFISLILQRGSQPLLKDIELAKKQSFQSN
ncbi:alpha/beta hydrolase family protein [Candidatus Phycosocius spiralis]|uniref:Peptidase S9 prolyl oligopeptidase catalytic domain-containing protein n=1 Tax=Candidatus Phycosocius spiralis TaxID=2815099 RepID=A0ABQ4PVT9_9PROT|nr:prolyl oligopeptidase family serine peptidase [Candidatus Phycosocius spiralis]GIU67105.1 hypothetical protein PsB1_1259 [Candidatus Phycosocius spiralis]